MIRIFIPLLITVLCIPGCKQKTETHYFTGTVGYAYSYSSESLDADSLARLRPSAGEFRYDTLNYQGRFIGADTTTYYYSGTRNRCISESGGPEKYSCEDYGAVTDSVLSWKLYDTDEKVLGMACRVLELQKKNSRVKYVVSREHRIAPATYRDHRAYNWDMYGEKAGGGLILKLEHDFGAFTMKGVATAVKREKEDFKALGIDEKLFEVLCKK